VEIIALLCEEWEDYGTDFKSICLEDPRHHRLTASNATVHVAIVATATATDTAATDAAAVSTPKNDDNHHEVVGYWRWKSSSSTAGGDGTTDSSSSSIVEPLYTRWQRKTCGPDGVDYCPETGSLDRFQPYRFVWSNASLPTDLPLVYARSSARLCYVGSSHAKQLLHSTWQVLGPAGVNVTYSYTRYPSQVTELLLQKMVDELRCNTIVIGIGQWAASYDGRRPFLFPQYEDATRTMLMTIQNFTTNYTMNRPPEEKEEKGGGLAIYLRSINYNPLGGVIASCPPGDWRSPMVIDGYNAILRHLTAEFQLPYIDASTHIVGPMWDSAADWCHYRNEVGDQIARYIVARVLNLVE
jgi:hypothetical protein